LIPETAGIISGDHKLESEIECTEGEANVTKEESECQDTQWEVESVHSTESEDMDHIELKKIMETAIPMFPETVTEAWKETEPAKSPPPPAPNIPDSDTPTTPIKTAIPPGSLLSDEARPPSPSNICDFPYFEPCWLEDQSLAVPVMAKTTTMLPRVVSDRDTMDWTTACLQSDDERELEELQEPQVIVYNVIAGIGMSGRAMVLNKMEKGGLADTGANCSMTANWSALSNIQQLIQPILVGLAVSNDSNITNAAECTHVGDYPVQCDDGTTIYTKCFYNPNASDTIISPQSLIDSSPRFHTWEQIGRKRGQPGQLRFVGPDDVKTVTLHQTNGLYYCNPKSYTVKADEDESVEEYIAQECQQDSPRINRANVDIHSTPKRKPKKYTPTPKHKILESETWYLRMGGCSETQLDQLPKHALGLPQKFEWHPFQFVDFREQARVRRQPVGRNPDRVTYRAARFYFDFGFIRASNEDFTRPSVKNDRVVESYDGYSSYLLVVDELTKYSWIFLTKTKDPPIELTRQFLKQFGHEAGGMIRCDQGGELARSEEWRTMVFKDFMYIVEPTGADSPSQNGQVERYNETVATITRTLLYGANLPAKYWSAAAVHAVYLMNREYILRLDARHTKHGGIPSPI
jgi:hypothetical protein